MTWRSAFGAAYPATALAAILQLGSLPAFAQLATLGKLTFTPTQGPVV